MKKYYDRKAVVRNFEEGSLVLVRSPDLRGKLGDQWQGRSKRSGWSGFGRTTFL